MLFVSVKNQFKLINSIFLKLKKKNKIAHKRIDTIKIKNIKL
jgi:hypothetical protein